MKRQAYFDCGIDPSLSFDLFVGCVNTTTSVIHTNASFDLIAFQVQTDRARGSGVRECLEIETSLFDESSEEIEKVTLSECVYYNSRGQKRFSQD